MVLAAAAPVDRHGYFSLGTNCDYVAPFIGRVPFFLEVNAQMPRTFGRNQVHVSQVVGWFEVDRPLLEVEPTHPSAVDERIAELRGGADPRRCDDPGRHRLDPERAALRAPRPPHLGVHTELLSDALIDLVERGVVTGTRKQLPRRRW